MSGDPRARRPLSWRAALAALPIGGVHALSFAPLAAHGGGWLQMVSLAAMLTLWLSGPAGDRRRAATIGAAFGLGWFTSGLYWLFISMHDFGGMPAPLAALALLLFAAYLSLFPAAVLAVVEPLRVGTRLRGVTTLSAGRPERAERTGDGGQVVDRGDARDRCWRADGIALALAFAGCWLIAEWLRGLLFTGFPWLAIGYAHVDSPLAGFAPVLGVPGVNGAAALVAIGMASIASAAIARRPAVVAPLLVCIALPLAIGQGLRQPAWTEADGPALQVRLIQGNVPQSMKFDSRHTVKAMRAYLAMIEQPPAGGPLDLIVLPETAWTVPWPGTPPDIAAAMFPPDAGREGVIAIGMPMTPNARSMHDATANRHDPLRVDIANSVLLLDRARGGEPIAQYDKHHLVPFGEFVPIGFQWFVRLMQIPLGSFTRGAIDQPPVPLRGQRLAFNICYEDLFGEELLPAVRQQASILINVSNLGWFGDSVALPQHLAIARMRAIETGRPMLRATNTGVTASIDAAGRVRARLDTDTIGSLDDSVQGMRGLTPYARWGNAPALALAFASLAIVAARRAARSRRASAIR